MRIQYLWKTLVLASFVVLGVPSGFAEDSLHDVMVLYHGTTETNREAMKFLHKQASDKHLPYTLRYTDSPSDITPGHFKKVVVLNTGAPDKETVDPKLAEFLRSYPAKGELILVTLVKGSKVLFVDSHTAPVDTIASASLWPSLLFGVAGYTKDQVVAMHEDWTSRLWDLVAKP